VVEELAQELRAAMGDSCARVTQARMERMLEKIPSVLTLPAATLAQRIFLLAAKLEREPGEILKHYTGQPQVLTSTADTLLGRVDELLACHAMPSGLGQTTGSWCCGRRPSTLPCWSGAPSDCRCLAVQVETRGCPACLSVLSSARIFLTLASFRRVWGPQAP
jgi:hypothetical protein